MKLINPDNTETIIEINIEKGSRVISNIPGPIGPQGPAATSETVHITQAADINMQGALPGNFLRWNGTQFVVTTTVLDDHLDVNAASPQPGEALLYNGQVWVPGAISGVTGFYVLKAGDSMDGQLDMNTNKIIDVGEPSAPTDVATKNYVDSLPRVHNGFGNPTDTVPVADDGDYYINKTTGMMHGPRGPVDFGTWTLTSNPTPAAGQYSFVEPNITRIHRQNQAGVNVSGLINAYFRPGAIIHFVWPPSEATDDTISTIAPFGGVNWTYMEVIFNGGGLQGLAANTPVTYSLRTQTSPESNICWPITINTIDEKSTYFTAVGRPDETVDPEVDYSAWVDRGILYGPKTQIVYGGWGYSTTSPPGATDFSFQGPDIIYINRTAYISQDQGQILERYLVPGNWIKFHSLTSGDFITQIYSAYGMADANAPAGGWEYARIRVNPAPPAGRWTVADNNVTISYWDSITGDVHWPETVDLGKRKKMKVVGGTTFTPTIDDENYLIILALTGAPNSIVFPSETPSTFIPMGFTLEFMWLSGPKPVFTDAVNSFVIGTPGKSLRALYSHCTAVKFGFNTWLIYGDLSA